MTAHYHDILSSVMEGIVVERDDAYTLGTIAAIALVLLLYLVFKHYIK